VKKNDRSGLDRMNNVDIQQDARESISALNAFLAQFDKTVKKKSASS
jgi:hypothetical protein